MKLGHRRGFSLIEVMVATAVLGTVGLYLTQIILDSRKATKVTEASVAWSVLQSQI